MQYALNYKVQGFCPLKIKITQFPGGFHLKSFQLFHFILLHEKLLQSDWLRVVVFQLNLKNLHVKITNLLRVVV